MVNTHPRPPTAAVHDGPRLITVDARRVGMLLMLAAVALTLLSVLTQALHHFEVAGVSRAETLTRVLNVDDERSLPTWYSVVLLSAGAGLFAATGAVLRHTHRARAWMMLAVLFVGLSVDELVGLHERTGPMLRSLFGVSVYAWVVPVALVGLAALPWLLRFVSSLPPTTRRWLIIAGLLYVGGGLVVEGLSGVYAHWYGEDNLGYELISSLEELLEMAGVAVLVAALLDHLQRFVAVTAASPPTAHD